MLASAALVSGVGIASAHGPAAEATERPGSRDEYFQHGVASGDPLPHAVIIWTRVTPTPESRPGSNKGPATGVQWEVATDERFHHVVRRGTFRTGPFRDHTVKVDVSGLRPATTYYYRFGHRHAWTESARTRTAPAHDASPDHLRFGVVSCANLQAGWFSAYRGLASREDLHAILFLGDYIYEYGPGQYGYGKNDIDIRTHVPGHEIISLADYRQRHAQYKQDRDLQHLHRKYAFIATWDDHEVADNAWKDGAVNHQPATEGNFHARRARAHRAYDEWMPARLNGTARLGDGDRLFRRFQFGDLLEVSMLDLRTYRDKQVDTQDSTPVPTGGPTVDDPSRTITGKAQMAWLKESLGRKVSKWKIIGNPVMITPVDFGALPKSVTGPIHDVTGLLPPDGTPYNTDQWDGYTADRLEVLDHIRKHKIEDVVFVTGDIHSGWAAEVPYDASTYPLGDIAAVEFVGTSVTSNNLKDILGAPPHTASRAVEQAILANNRHIKYLNFDDHGFAVLDVTHHRVQMDWFIIGDRAVRNTPITWTKSYATASGTNKIKEQVRPVRSLH